MYGKKLYLYRLLWTPVGNDFLRKFHNVITLKRYYSHIMNKSCNFDQNIIISARKNWTAVEQKMFLACRVYNAVCGIIGIKDLKI